MRYLHTTIHVKDLEESVKFYEEFVGLKIVNRISAGPMQIVFLADGVGGTAVELIRAEPGESFVREGISIGFGADDLECVMKAADDKNYKHSGMIQPNPHVKFFFVDDPDGVSVQFCQNV